MKTTTPTLRALSRAAILATSAWLAACGGGGSGGDAGSDSDAQDNETSSSAIECEAERYACLWKDVAKPVIERGESLAIAMDGQLAGGKKTAEVVAWLKQQEPKVVLQYDEQIIRFRLPEGRPVWVAAPGVLRAPAAPGETLPGAAAARTAQPAGEREQALGVVAPGKPGKRALVLAPFAYEIGMSSAEPVAEILGDTPGYEGRVDYKANRDADASDVEVDSFRDFEQYDVIHVDTHGWQLCHDLETGEPLKACKAFVTAKDLNHQIDLIEQKNVGVEVVRSEGKTKLILTTDFFRHTYPRGLDDRLFYFDACSPTGNAAIASALHGSNSAFFGWNGAVKTIYAHAMGRYMFEGLQAGRRLQDVFASSGSDFVQPNGTRGVTDGRDIRIRELISASDAQTGNLLADKEPMLVSLMPGDGQNDSLLLQVVVDGVEAAQAGKFVLSVYNDGKLLKEVGLADAETIGDYRRRVSFEAALGFDAKPDQILKLKFVVTLPEGGTSTLEVSPKVDDPSKLPAEYQMESQVHMDLIGGDRYMTAKAIWELEPEQDLSKPYRYYRVKSGTLSWEHSFKMTRDNGECVLKGSGTMAIQGGDSSRAGLRIDFSGTPTMIYGSASTPRQPAQIKGRCWTEDLVVGTRVGGTYLNAWGVAVDTRGPFSGRYRTGSKLPTTIDWTFTPVKSKR